MAKEKVEIDSDESWETDEESGDREDLKRNLKCTGRFFEADRFNPVYLNDSIMTWSKIYKGTDYPISSIHVVTPSQFYVQLVHMREQLQKMSEKLSEFCEQSGVIGYNYNLSELCMANHENEWRRAAVIKKFSLKSNGEPIDERTYEVQCFDYGFTVTVDSSKMRPLVRSHLRTPVQAYCCGLAGIAPVKGAWTQEAIQYFKKITEEKLVKCIRIVEDNGEGRILVWMEKEVPKGIKCADVGSMLIKGGFAKKIE